MKLPNHISYLEIAFYVIAITAFCLAILMFFLVAFSDILVLPKEEAIEYVLGDPFAKPSNQ